MLKRVHHGTQEVYNERQEMQAKRVFAAYNRMLDIGCSVHKQTVFQRLIGKSSSILETLNGGERPKLLLEEVLL